MTALEQLLAIASDDQLRATRRLLHRAYLGRQRLGWPTLNPFYGRRQGLLDRFLGPEYDLGAPVLLAATCLELSAELTRRSAALPCLPCLAEVEQSLTGHLPRTDEEAVGSGAAAGTGG